MVEGGVDATLDAPAWSLMTIRGPVGSDDLIRGRYVPIIQPVRVSGGGLVASHDPPARGGIEQIRQRQSGHRATGCRCSAPARRAAVLVDVGRQGLVGRDELLPPCRCSSSCSRPAKSEARFSAWSCHPVP